jgi:hypothetical protein
MISNCYRLFLVVVLVVGSALLLAGPAQAQSKFAGTENCNNCHGKEASFAGKQWETWKNTRHAQIYRDPDLAATGQAMGVVPDADFKSGLNLGTVPDFAKYGANSPVLGYDAGVGTSTTDTTSGYTVKIGAITYPIHRAHGGTGEWKQRFHTRIGNSWYILPIQYNEKTKKWVTYNPLNWYNASNQPLYTNPATLATDIDKSQSEDRKCIGCHATGIDPTFDAATGEWKGNPKEWNIGCEACHGPGGTASHTNFGLSGQGFNPAKLTDLNRKLEVCGQCHTRGESIGLLGNKKFEYPYKDGVGIYRINDVLADFYDSFTPVTSPSVFWQDLFTSKSHHQQYLDFGRSGHGAYDPAKPWVNLNCFTCHEPHGNTTNAHQVVDKLVEGGVTIPTKVADNSLCLACHASHGPFAKIRPATIANMSNPDSLALISQEVQRHTRHPYDPTGTTASSCTGCHTPKVQSSAIAYDISAHTFDVMPPANTLKYPMPNSCALCHNKNAYGEGAADTLIAVWNNAEDKTIATWGDNYYAMFSAPQRIGLLDARKIASGSPQPVLDGVADDIWNAAPPDTIPMRVAGVSQSGMWAELRALYTDTDLYVYAKWPDPDMTVRREELVYQNGTWSTTTETDLTREDRIGIFWPMTDVAGFESRGCMATCHNTRERWGKYVAQGELGDLWHSKSARTSPGGYVDDTFTDGNIDFAGDGGRHGDASGSTSPTRDNIQSGVPLWMGATHDANPAALYDNTWSAPPVAGTWAVAGKPYDPNAGWQNGDRLPRFFMTSPTAGSSRNDIRTGSKWENGYWIMEMKRALNTGDPARDVIFNDLKKDYPFAVALIDNGTQPAGRVFPNLHSHQGGDYELLRFGVTTGVSEPIASNQPSDFRLSQNYPNPFNPSTKIEFSVPKNSRVVLKVYNALGVEVATVVDEQMSTGTYRVRFDGSRLASGIYFYRLKSGDFVASKKMILIR